MKILVITNLFPNKLEPERATYNRQQVCMLSKFCEIKVLAPIAWYPFKCSFDKNIKISDIPNKEIIDGIEVFHPKYFMIPKVGRSLYGILFFFSILLPILKIYGSFKFDVIFATWAYPDSFASVLISKFLKMPIITKVHGTDINEYSQYWLRRRMISFTLNNSDKVISVSKALKKRMIEIGVRSEKIKVIYNGINSNIFRPLDRIQTRKELGISLDKKVILFVGNLRPVKGLDYLIDAFTQIAKSGNIQLIIIGEGELRKHLEDKIRKYNIQDYIYMPGNRPHNEITKWMNASDLLCLPSLSEGVPNVILESLSCGVPVVASNVGGIPEIIISSDYGITVEPGNTSELKKALLECLVKTWNRDLIHVYSNKFSWYNNVKEIYHEIENIYIKGQC